MNIEQLEDDFDIRQDPFSDDEYEDYESEELEYDDSEEE